MAYFVTLVIEVTAVALAYHASPTYWSERFDRTVGHRDAIISTIAAITQAGAVLAAAALLHPFRRRGPALLALYLNLHVLNDYGQHFRGDTFVFYDWQVFVIHCGFVAVTITMLLRRYRAHRLLRHD